MNVLITTDAFPPVCGGSGWSTYELARGLRSRGHHITVVQPRPGRPAGIADAEYDGFRVHAFGAPAPNLPYLRNYFKSERLTAALGDYLGTFIDARRFDVVHAQHVMTTVASVAAGSSRGIATVATVRDYWPVCYWSDLLQTREGLSLCPACTPGNMVTCIQPRAGAAWPLAVPLIPYMRANLARKRRGLAGADAIIAVSRRIADDLRGRAPELAASRIEIIPNPVRVAPAAPDAGGLDAPYALYLGKLAPNKGSQYLVDVVTRADLDWPLVVAGDGPGRTGLETAARASGRDLRFVGWVDHAKAAALLSRASMLIFPSRGPESLSRVLLEASAYGIPIAAMDTGGTRDIIEPDATGLLSNTPEGLGDDVRRLRHDAALRERLGRGAAAKAARDFDAAAVVERVERVYESVRRR